MTATKRSALLLSAVGGLAIALTLAFWHWTRGPIDAAQRHFQQQQWLAVLPAASYDNDPLQAPLTLAGPHLAHSQLVAGYRASRQGQPTAILLLSRTQGYAGPIDLAIAIDLAGRLLAIKVLQQQESPGLGDQVASQHLNWLGQFNGRTGAARWALKRDQGDFDQLAGATVTSRAVMAALQDALRYVDAHRTTLGEAQVDE